MRIGVCGLGKLGLCIASAFAVVDGVDVTGFDVDKQKIAQLRKGAVPIQEPYLAEFLQSEQAKKHLQAVWSPGEMVYRSDCCLFVTPTPSLPDGSFDHSFLVSAIGSVAKEVRKQHKENFLFLVTSTVMPGFMSKTADPLIRRFVDDMPFQLAYKPELIAIGTVLRDLQYPDLMIIGESSPDAGRRVEELFRLMIRNESPAKRMPLLEAELAKISLNCAVTMKISFANQVGLVARNLGADPHVILDAIGNDRRIGHAAMHCGLPFSGPCFPRDNRMFQYVAAQAGERAHLAEATDAINRRVLRAIIEKLPEQGEVGILGLSYKPGTSLTEESPGRWWRNTLMSRGRRVKAYDPLVSSPNTLQEVMRCAVVILATAHEEFSGLRFGADTLVIDPMAILKQEQLAESAA